MFLDVWGIADQWTRECSYYGGKTEGVIEKVLFDGLPGLEMEVGGGVGVIQRGSGRSSLVVIRQFSIFNVVADTKQYT